MKKSQQRGEPIGVLCALVKLREAADHWVSSNGGKPDVAKLILCIAKRLSREARQANNVRHKTATVARTIKGTVRRAVRDA